MSDASGQSKRPVTLEPNYDEAFGLTAEEVRAFLLKHPDFFANNPDILERLVSPHEEKGAVSLVERQSEQLR